MRLTVFNTKRYDRRFLELANAPNKHDLRFLEPRLTLETAGLADGGDGVCAFVNDELPEPVLNRLAHGGVRLIALRCGGYNQVDLAAAERHGLTVVHVPAYSPYAVAEHTLALILALNRHIPSAYNRVRERNFSIDGLLGFDLHGKTVAVIGTGKIGLITGQILQGFGCRVQAFDPFPSPAAQAAGFRFGDLTATLSGADIITLHCPLTPQTRHLINPESLARTKPGAMLINTSRGGLIDTPAVLDALLSRQLGYLGIDVYEDEAELFYEDRSADPLEDALFARLLSMPNVLITGHQGFFTHEALTNIAETTLRNVTAFAAGEPLQHVLTRPPAPAVE
jgi:D-lactate dehydrogenase